MPENLVLPYTWTLGQGTVQMAIVVLGMVLSRAGVISGVRWLLITVAVSALVPSIFPSPRDQQKPDDTSEQGGD